MPPNLDFDVSHIEVFPNPWGQKKKVKKPPNPVNPNAKPAQFTTELKAIQFTGSNLMEVYALLGFEVEGNKINMTAQQPKGTPMVEVHQSLYEGTTINLSWGDSRQSTLVIGMWAVRMGDYVTTMTEPEFGSLAFM